MQLQKTTGLDEMFVPADNSLHDFELIVTGSTDEYQEFKT